MDKDKKKALERESVGNGAGTLKGILKYLSDFGTVPAHVVILTNGVITAKYEGKDVSDIKAGRLIASSLTPRATDMVGNVLLVFAPSGRLR